MRKPLGSVIQEFILDKFKEENTSGYNFAKKYNIAGPMWNKIVHEEHLTFQSTSIDRLMKEFNTTLKDVLIVIPQINTTYKCIRKASLSINTDKGDGQTCFFCGQIKTTS